VVEAEPQGWEQHLVWLAAGLYHRKHGPGLEGMFVLSFSDMMPELAHVVQHVIDLPSKEIYQAALPAACNEIQCHGIGAGFQSGQLGSLLHLN